MPEQMRASYPDRDGFIERDGVRVFYELYGSGTPTLLLAPTWSIIHSRVWKAQIPYLARHYRVVTFDPRGNGRSDHPATRDAYEEREFAADTIAVMDATETDRAVLVSLSLGAQRTLIVAAGHPARVSGLVFICPAVSIGERPARRQVDFETVNEIDEDWGRYNRHAWLRDYRGFSEWFFGEMFSEPHSTKPTEDAVGWSLGIDPQTLIEAEYAAWLDADETLELIHGLTCPVLVIQGEDDRVTGPGRGIALAAATGGKLALLEGAGHAPNARDPVHVNLLVRDFVEAIGRDAR